MFPSELEINVHVVSEHIGEHSDHDAAGTDDEDGHQDARLAQFKVHTREAFDEGRRRAVRVGPAAVGGVRPRGRGEAGGAPAGPGRGRRRQVREGRAALPGQQLLQRVAGGGAPAVRVSRRDAVARPRRRVEGDGGGATPRLVARPQESAVPHPDARSRYAVIPWSKGRLIRVPGAKGTTDSDKFPRRIKEGSSNPSGLSLPNGPVFRYQVLHLIYSSGYFMLRVDTMGHVRLGRLHPSINHTR